MKAPDERWIQHTLTKWWKEALGHGTVEKVDQSRNEFLRPSALPFCPVKVGYKRGVFGPEEDRHRSFNESFYTDIGHAAHYLAQNLVGRMPVKTLDVKVLSIGHWKCTNWKCSGRRYFCSYKKCPTCKGAMEYVEIEIKWRNTVGHIDKVLLIGKFLIIVDYKTCGTYALRKHRDGAQRGEPTLPYTSNKAQITRYTGLFEKVFAKEFEPGGPFEGCTVLGSVLIYVSRETVREHEFIWLPADQETKDKQYAKALRDDKLFVRMKRAAASKDIKDFDILIKYKPCKSKAHYMKNMHSIYSECPLVKVCFADDDNKKLRAKIKHDLAHPPESD